MSCQAPKHGDCMCSVVRHSTDLPWAMVVLLLAYECVQWVGILLATPPGVDPTEAGVPWDAAPAAQPLRSTFLALTLVPNTHAATGFGEHAVGLFVAAVVIVSVVCGSFGWTVHAEWQKPGSTFHAPRWRHRLVSVTLQVLTVGFPSVVMGVLTSPFTCALSTERTWLDTSYECWSGSHTAMLIIGVACAATFLAAAVLFTLLALHRVGVHETNAKHAMAASVGRVQASALTVRLLGVAILVNIMAAASTARLVVVFVIALAWAASYAYFLPYHHQWLNREHAVCGGLVAGGAAGGLVAVGVCTAGNNAAVALLVVTAILGTVPAYCFARLRWDAQGATPVRVGADLRSALAIDLYARHVYRHVPRASIIHADDGVAATDDDVVPLLRTLGGGHGVASSTVGAARGAAVKHAAGSSAPLSASRVSPAGPVLALYKAATALDDACSLLHLQYAELLGGACANPHLERLQLVAAMSHADAWAIDVQCFAYQRLRELDEQGLRGAHMTLARRLAFEQAFADANKLVDAARDVLLEFWTVVADRHPDHHRTQVVGGRLTKALADADAALAAAHELSPRSIPLLRVYGEFLLDVTNDTARAVPMLEDADQLEEEQARQRAAVTDIALDFGAHCAVDLAYESLGLITIAGDAVSFGAITECNAAALRVLGLSRREMLGRSFCSFVAAPLARQYEAYMHDFMENGIETLLGRPHISFMQHRAGHLLPVRLLVSMDASSTWTVVVEEIESMDGFMMFSAAADGSWPIVACNARAAADLQIDVVSLASVAPPLRNMVRNADELQSILSMLACNLDRSPPTVQLTHALCFKLSADGFLQSGATFVQRLNASDDDAMVCMLRYQRGSIVAVLEGSRSPRHHTEAAVAPGPRGPVDGNSKRALRVMLQEPAEAGLNTTVAPCGSASSNSEHVVSSTWDSGHPFGTRSDPDMSPSSASGDADTSRLTGEERFPKPALRINPVPTLMYHDDEAEAALSERPSRRNQRAVNTPAPASNSEGFASLDEPKLADATPQASIAGVSEPPPGAPASVAGPIGSIHSHGTGTSITSMTDLLRRAALGRGVKMERALVRLHRVVLLMFCLMFAMNLTSVIIAGVLFDDVRRNTLRVFLSGQRSVAHQDSYAALQNLRTISRGEFPTGNETAERAALLEHTTSALRLNQLLYGGVDGALQQENDLYFGHSVQVIDLVPGTYVDAATFNTSSRTMNLVSAEVQYASTAKRVAALPLASITSAHPDQFWLERNGPVALRDAFMGATSLAEHRNAMQANIIELASWVVLATAGCVFALKLFVVMLPAVLHTVRQQQRIFDVFLLLPVAELRAARARVERRLAEDRRAAENDDMPMAAELEDKALLPDDVDAEGEVRVSVQIPRSQQGVSPKANAYALGTHARGESLIARVADWYACHDALRERAMATVPRRREFRRRRSERFWLAVTMTVPVLVTFAYFGAMHAWTSNVVTDSVHLRAEALAMIKVWEYSGELQYRVRAAAPRCAHNFVVAQIAEFESAAFEATSQLDGLLFGNANAQLRPQLQHSPATERLFMEDGCGPFRDIDSVKFDECKSFQNGILSRGLYAGWQDYVRRCTAATSAVLADRDQGNCTVFRSDEGDIGVARLYSDEYFPTLFYTAAKIQLDDADATLRAFVVARVAVMVLSTFVSLLAYWLVYRRKIYTLDKRTKQTRMLLTLLPEDLMRRVPYLVLMAGVDSTMRADHAGSSST